MTLPTSEAQALEEPLLPTGDAGNDDESPVELASDPSEIVVHQVHVDNEQEAFLDENGDVYEAGEVQGPGCRDPIFAVLFVAQAAVVVSFAVLGVYHMCNQDWDIPNESTDDNEDSLPNSIHPTKVLLFLVSTIGSILVLSAMLVFMLLGPLSEMMIQASLVISPLTCGLGAVVMLVMGNVFGAAMFALISLIGIFYAVRVWHRIPFAAANIHAAVQAVQANKGVIPTAYVMTLATSLWILLWSFSLAYTTVVKSHWMLECQPKSENNGEDECELTTRGKWILVGLLLSFYWTIQVFKNVFQVTLSGVVGTWWFAPQDCAVTVGCCGRCSQPLRDSWFRATIYSFGSICFGSLIVAILQVLKFLVRMARQQQEQENRRQGRASLSLMWCLLQCVVELLEKLVKYINKWAFVYVGLYGYDYWTSSKKVYGLFRARGWTVIINDHLVSRSLAMMQLFIGIISGALGSVFGFILFGPVGVAASFFIGLICGFIFSDVVLQVISSAVNTIVVCFAEAPNPLQRNHPECYNRLVTAWRDAYPREFSY